MPNKSNKKQMEQLYNDILNIAKQATAQLAEDVTYEIEIAYEQCIEAFYNHYEKPRYYDRTYSTFYASSMYEPEIMSENSYYGSGNRLYNKNKYNYTFGASYDDEGVLKTIQKTNHGYIAGITIDPSRILEESPAGPYRAKDTAWVFERTFIDGIHGLTSEEVMTGAWLDESKPTPWYRYPVITGRRGWQKRPMSKTPYARMNEKFAKIYKGMGKTSDKILLEAFRKATKLK